ncbi:MAG: hypothetical protein HY074_00195 [Deltaproteobacteria bacterium]|nr:hypothetical protein [Deltaproteobacteria bacterium]
MSNENTERVVKRKQPELDWSRLARQAVDGALFALGGVVVHAAVGAIKGAKPMNMAANDNGNVLPIKKVGTA